MTVDPLSETVTLANEPSTPPLTPSAGTLLRGYREALGIKAEALAAKLHVPIGKLLALEQDRLDALPDAMFARALTLAVCRQLQADPAPVLARLPQKDLSRLASHNERGLDFPLKRPSLLPASGLGAWLAWPRWVWGVMGLAAVVIIALSSWSTDSVPALDSASQVVLPLTPKAGMPASASAPLLGPVPALTDVSSPNLAATVNAPTLPQTPVPPVIQSGKMVVTPVQPNVVVLTPVSPSISTEGASK